MCVGVPAGSCPILSFAHVDGELYSDFVQIWWVLVPADYVPNTLRSVGDITAAGYPVRQANDTIGANTNTDSTSASSTDANNHVLLVDGSTGPTAYTINGLLNPSVRVSMGGSYTFVLQHCESHPFCIQTTAGTGQVNLVPNINNNCATTGNITVTIDQHNTNL